MDGVSSAGFLCDTAGEAARPAARRAAAFSIVLITYESSLIPISRSIVGFAQPDFRNM
jgi:hypothetical protein